MKLVLREYLSMLKEREELDSLVPDLLLSMDIEVIRMPQRGVPEHGVDVAGVGPDPIDGQRKLLLFTIKSGDITRQSWDASGDLQGVRRSLNDIKDAYLQHRVSEEHADLPKKVVLCCGGELKRNVEDRWSGYVKRNVRDNKLEYEFWGGDRLALLIEKHMLGENLFPKSARKQIRKTISLVDENERPPRHFYNLARETLFKRDLPTGGRQRDIRERQRAFRTLNLSLNIVFHWCQEADNLRPALLCAERTLLTAWDWKRENKLFDCDTTSEEFARLFMTYFRVAKAFAIKIAPHCLSRDGLTGQGTGQGYDATEYSIRTFDAIGILSLASLAQQFLIESISPKPTEREEEPDAENVQEVDERSTLSTTFEQEAKAMGGALAALITNNPAALTPCYDEQVIEMSIGLLALIETGGTHIATEWTEQLARRISFAYANLGRNFPIATDSYEDLVALDVGDAPPKEELLEMSTFLPVLAHWHAVLDLPESYEDLSADLDEVFTETHLQMWYPDDKTDAYLYNSNAGRESGMTLSPMQFPDSIQGLKEQIQQLDDERGEYKELSCIKQGWPILSLIASRHFRTPVIPAFWQGRVVINSKNRGDDNPDGSIQDE